jgi:hypothetical protein
MATNNPLHDFRSYSYHQILIACDTTSAAKSVSELKNDSTGVNQGGFNSQVFQKPGAEKGIQVNSIEGGNYIVVINGAKDSEFNITEAKWNTLVIPSVVSNNNETIHATTMATEGTIGIIEPKGIRFINVINDVGNALLTGPTGITWVLKTIFIGHVDDGTVRYLTQVKPIMMFMANISANFDTGGASYEFEFIGQTNGASKIPQISALKIPSFNIPKDRNSLDEVFGFLFSAINNEYQDYLIKSGQQDEPGREIIYKYKLDQDSYESLSYKVDQLQINQRGSVAYGKKLNIEQAITQLMLKCSKVKEDSVGTPKYIFKIHSTLETNETQAVVTYFVRRFIQPESNTIDGSKGINVPTDENTLEFDYLYTGKNVDIIEFDIKMQMGMAFFQLLETTESLRDYQGEQPNSGNSSRERKIRSENSTESDGDNQATSIRAGINIDKKKSLRIKFPAKKYTKVLQQNSKSGLSSADFQSALNQHAALENLEAKVSIIGNPILLSDMNIMPSEVNSSIGDINNTQILTKWLHTPMLCKINIRMPSSSSLTGDADGRYSVPFWYQGHYTILAVEHSFSNGVFTQDLNLLSIPQETP